MLKLLSVSLFVTFLVLLEVFLEDVGLVETTFRRFLFEEVAGELGTCPDLETGRGSLLTNWNTDWRIDSARERKLLAMLGSFQDSVVFCYSNLECFTAKDLVKCCCCG